MKIAKFTIILIFLLITVPIFNLFYSFFNIDLNNWNHLVEYVLPEVFMNSIKLILGVSTLTTIFAFIPAYLQTFYDFKFKSLINIFTLLPLAFPLYIYASLFLNLFDITGEFTLWLYKNFGLSPHNFNIKNLLGLIFVYSLTLYPYLYLSLSESFSLHGQKAFNVGANLGLNRIQIIFKILIPASKPWFIAGVLLIIMEMLADYGASSLFNINTFSSAIYRSWFGLFSIKTASQIASLLILFIYLIYMFQKITERKKDYSSDNKSHFLTQEPLNLYKKIILYSYFFVFFFFSLLIPLFFLFKSTFKFVFNHYDTLLSNYLPLIKNTLFISFVGAMIIIFIALVMAIIHRFYFTRMLHWYYELTKMGYAIPGAIMAVAIYIPLNRLDIFVFSKPYLTLTLIPLFIGYLIRFLSVALNPLEVSFKKISNPHLNILENLGLTKKQKIQSIYFPLMYKSLMATFFLVLLEVFKELPVTLMMRPFGYDTLATKIFEYTSEGNWDLASLPSLVLFIVGCMTLAIVQAIKHNISRVKK